MCSPYYFYTCKSSAPKTEVWLLNLFLLNNKNHNPHPPGTQWCRLYTYHGSEKQ